MIEPVVQTARLLLRPPVEADLEGWAAFMCDETAMRHLGGCQPRPVAWQRMAMARGSWALRGYGYFSVIECSSGRWIGRVGPLRPEGWPGTEIGWGLLPETWGRGYATEAAAAAMDFAIDTLGWTDIIHVISPENTPSSAVAARLGSRYRGPGRLPPPYGDQRADIWGQSAAEWRERRRVTP
ncbi:MAG TPA: GNAT family N-acetyltransferase [Acetobacteraceae bacterium]|jgi:RimJ/RimL family protein N-acetyltransferase|nr:GNAT family N-acetyltransferase [Acetobacteraceae bacterium]